MALNRITTCGGAMRVIAPGPLSARADMERALGRMAVIALALVILCLFV